MLTATPSNVRFRSLRSAAAYFTEELHWISK